MKWLRLYDEVLDDPKVQRLHPALFKHWINLLCLASQQAERGTLPDVAGIAFRLRLFPAQAQRVLEQLVSAALVARESDGSHTLPAWQRRQSPSDDVAQRVAKHRGRITEKNMENVTLQETLPTALLKRNSNASRRRDTDSEEEKILSTPIGVALATPRQPIVKEQKSAPKPTHPAVTVVRDTLHFSPDATQRAAITGAVQDESGEIARWLRCCTEWRLRGFNVRNLAGVMEWFAGGEPPPRMSRNGKVPAIDAASSTLAQFEKYGA